MMAITGYYNFDKKVGDHFDYENDNIENGDDNDIINYENDNYNNHNDNGNKDNNDVMVTILTMSGHLF